jgi:hypothetical protein
VTQQPRGSAPDPIGDFQRWLVRSGARSVSRELGGHIAGAFGLGGKPGDVWENATAPPSDEAPECAWCPVCRAARLLRVSGPGLASQVAAASDTLATLVQDAASVVESALAAGKRPGGQPPAGGRGSAFDAETFDEAKFDAETLADRDAASSPERAAAAAAEPAAAGPGAGADEEPAAEAVWAEATGNGAAPAGPATGNGTAAPGPADGPASPRSPE